MSKLWAFGDSFTFGHGCRKFSSDSSSPYNVKYANYIDLDRPIWPEHVSSMLGFELLNYGVSGVSNDYIIDSIFDNLSVFKNDDIIIIQLSTGARYDFPFLKEKKLLGGWEVNQRDNMYNQDNKSPYFFKTIFSANIAKDYENVGEDALTFSTSETYKKQLKLSKEKYDLIKNFFVEFISTKKYYERQVWRFIKLSNFLTSLGFQIYLIHEDYWPTMYEKPKYLISTSEDGILQKIIRDRHTIMDDTNYTIIDYHPSYDGHLSIAESILKHINENSNLYNT